MPIKSFVYDGTKRSIFINNETLPEGIPVSYTGNGIVKAGKFEVVAVFSVPDTSNYKPIESMKATLTITPRKITSITFVGAVKNNPELFTYVYNGNPFTITAMLSDILETRTSTVPMTSSTSGRDSAPPASTRFPHSSAFCWMRTARIISKCPKAAATDAGSYTASVTLDATYSNYKLPAIGTNRIWKIAAQQVTQTFETPESPYVYTGAEQSVNVVVRGADGTVLESVLAVVSFGRDVIFLNAGNYIATATGLVDAEGNLCGNYQLSFAEGAVLSQNYDILPKAVSAVWEVALEGSDGIVINGENGFKNGTEISITPVTDEESISGASEAWTAR